MKCLKPNQSGVSLFELMIAIAILSILAFVAVPSLQSFSGTSTQRAAIDQLLSSIQFARSEAISKGQVVSLCKHGIQPLTCDENSGSWGNGWSVFRAGNNVTRTWDGPRAGIQINDVGNVHTRIEFQPTGMANRVHQIRVSSQNRPDRCISIQFNGRATVGDCV